LSLKTVTKKNILIKSKLLPEERGGKHLAKKPTTGVRIQIFWENSVTKVKRSVGVRDAGGVGL